MPPIIFAPSQEGAAGFVAPRILYIAMMHMSPKVPLFVHVAHGRDGSNHSIGITGDGIAYSWGTSNSMGQLGRSSGNITFPQPVMIDEECVAYRSYAGGLSESGHSAILNESRSCLYVAGCDRWQQLGLGSSKGGASGYTWGDGGRIWRSEFVPNLYLQDFMRDESKSTKIRDVALGADHTVVLSENRKHVYTFGKGGEGQLGIIGKPFVSAPVRSSKLSSNKEGQIAAICAINHCSLTLDDHGNILKKAGKCRTTRAMKESLNACIQRAKQDGLLQSGMQKKSKES
jgi:alpha-tubulin suppressor-like RCC1 family protein